MHEYSLAGEVIKIAQSEAERNNAVLISEITIEAGKFSGVDPDAFESALRLLSEGTLLEGTELKIERINGIGICRNCNLEFEMDKRFDTCPRCNSFPSEIKGGREFRIASIVIEEKEKIQ